MMNPSVPNDIVRPGNEQLAKVARTLYGMLQSLQETLAPGEHTIEPYLVWRIAHAAGYLGYGDSFKEFVEGAILSDEGERREGKAELSNVLPNVTDVGTA